jgi:hypothetical protein
VSIEEFQANLATYGPDLANWPEPQREAARIVMTTSEYARQMLAVEVLLKKELGDKKVVAPKGLVDRIVGKALGTKTDKPKP